MSVFRVLAGVDPTLAFENPVEVLRAAAGDPDAALGPAQERLDGGAWIAGYLGYDGSIALGVFDGPREVALPYDGTAPHSPLLSSVDRDEYEAAIGELQRSIYEGDVYQVNYTVPFAFETQATRLLCTLATRAGPARSIRRSCEDGPRAILSWSPELFLAFDGARVETKPMKGTAPLDRIEELGSDKNRAEHLMIVDLLRNDLHRICDRVRVEELFAVERYPTFATMTSTIAGDLRDGVTLGRSFAPRFPAAASPARRSARRCRPSREANAAAAASIAARSASFRRSGAAGGTSPSARRRSTRPSGIGRFDAGGGIVADSKAAEEWDEIRLKSRFPGPRKILRSSRRSPATRTTPRWARTWRACARRARAFGIDFDGAGLIDALGVRASHYARGDGGHLIRVRLHADGRFEILDEELERLAQPVRDPLSRSARSQRRSVPAAQDDVAPRAGCSKGGSAPQRLLRGAACNERGELTEGWRTNLFVERDGVTWTPPVASGLLPGILRSRLVSEGRVRERAIAAEELHVADAIYVGNSARGLLRASLVT